MRSKAEEVALKYSVDYKELVGRGKSHQVQDARRELVYQLVNYGCDPKDVAKFLDNRNVNSIMWLFESFRNRDDNKRKPYVRRAGSPINYLVSKIDNL